MRRPPGTSMIPQSLIRALKGFIRVLEDLIRVLKGRPSNAL